jgi:hypothetical protein
MQPPPTRSLRATFVLLMLLVPLVGAWAPHVVAYRAGPAAPHVESAGTPSCPASHNEDRCLACQAINLRVVVTNAAPVSIPEAVAHGGWWQAGSPCRAATIASPTQPRAPPVRIT